MKTKTSITSNLMIPALIVGFVLVITGFILAFTVARLVPGDAVLDVPVMLGGEIVTNKPLLSQKIFYFHVPVAIVSMVLLFFTALYSILYLKTRNATYDLRARTATEVSLAFILMTMASGIFWTRFEWGVWWTWDPRLTTYFILMLMVFGYFVLRNALGDPERRAVYSSVFGIIIFIDVPICFMITRLVPNSAHPVVFRSDSGLDPPMLASFLIAMAGFACIAFALYQLRKRTMEMNERLFIVKEKLEEL